MWALDQAYAPRAERLLADTPVALLAWLAAGTAVVALLVEASLLPAAALRVVVVTAGHGALLVTALAWARVGSASRGIALALLAVAATASAIGPAGAVTQPGKCTKLTTKSGSAGNIVATVSGCTPLAATGGKGSGTFKAGQTSGTLNATLKWANNKGTTSAKVKLAPQATPGKCPPGTSRIKVTGSVTGGTGAAGRTFKKGQPVTGSVCANAKTGGASLEPGTALKF